ncbi:response regulator transcription factor [Streptomyces sp. MAR4 CNX-425]|uniref:response regulator transcription factor n=1 Tax=Streptomyces sp. MAR4 CNX-425 TaxID=3406343 RepID=UPI003B5037B6
MREAAARSRRPGPCTAELAGRSCPRPAEYTLFVGGSPFRFCAACSTMAVHYLLDQQVPAAEVVTQRLPDPPGPAARADRAEPDRPDGGPDRRPRLLMIEDDEALQEVLAAVLTRQGYEILAEGTGRAGLRSAYLQRPDLILLDYMLPDIDGGEVLRRLRTVSDVPVIYLTARDDSIDVVSGLESGADDYVVKPFQFKELRARIDRVLHRYRAAERRHGDVFDDGVLRLDSPRQRAWAAGSPLALSGTEFRVLDRLVRHAETVQHFATLLETGWDAPPPGARGRVKFTVSRLRGKLDATPVGGESIVSVRGLGYLYRSPAAPALPPLPGPRDGRGRAAGTATAPGGYGHAPRVPGPGPDREREEPGGPADPPG